MADDKPFVSTLKKIFDEMVTLNIVTVVGTVAIKDGWVGKGDELTVSGAGAKALWTKVDLLQGDISRVIHPDFVGDAGQALRDYHRASEEQGMAIIKANVETLEKIATLAAKAIEGKLAGGA